MDGAMSVIINGTTGISGVDGSASTPAVQGADTNTGVFFGTDTVTIATGGTAAVTVDSGQRTKFPTTIGVGNATPSTSGSGISFPASQSASTDANTLDDYEEGTWTPTFFGSSSAGTTTYNSRAGNYTKVGRLVTVNASMAISSATGTGAVTIGGFPFTSATGTQGRCVPMVNNVNWSGGSYLIIFMYESNTLCEVFYSGDDIAWANQNMTNESMDWVFSMTYVAAA
jgi:hypothetical protein